MTQEEFQESINNEVKGAEVAVNKMLLYYISALQTVGVEDVKQYIATRISEMIQLSEEQCNFIKANFTHDNKLIENMKNSVQLLQNMEDKKELDLDSIKIVKQIIELIIKDYDELK